MARHGQGDRRSKTLAWAFRKERQSTYIVAIEGKDGEIKVDSQGIREEFREYYDQLYTSWPNPGHDVLIHYLDEMPLGWVDQEQGSAHNVPITEDEIRDPIKSLPNGKAPGMDGITAEFYKAYADLVIPHLMRMYESALDTGSLPEFTRSALVTVLLKPGKNPD